MPVPFPAALRLPLHPYQRRQGSDVGVTSQPQAIVFDFSRVILFPKDDAYRGGLNSLHRTLTEQNPGYPFFEHFRLNAELLVYLRQLKSVLLYIFTSGNIQEVPAVQSGLGEIFRAVYSAERLGVNKSDPASYLTVCQAIGIEPHQVLIVDDSRDNLGAANRAGLQTHLYTDNHELMNFLKPVA